MTATGFKAPQGAVLAAVLFALGLCIGYSLRFDSSAGQTGLAPPRLRRRTAAATPPAATDSATTNRFHQAPCPPPRQLGVERRNLVFAAVGDSWSPAKWSFSERASWDLVAVYYGNRTDWSCQECTLALRMPDSMKWQMVWALMTADGGGGKNRGRREWAGVWERLRGSYDYVMVTDDDLIMDVCTIDIFFQSMRRNQLLAAQPSNCRGNDSDNPYWVHWQLPGLELHYVNVVEVTAPGLDMRFLDTKMRPYLEHTFSGWGLPFCFWAASGFATKKLAAIDAACMMHPTRKDVGKKMLVSERIRQGLVKPGSIYARFSELTPFASPKAEQLAVWEKCGFTEPSARGNRPLVLGTVLAAPQAAAEAAGTALTAGWWASPPQQQQQQQQQQQGLQPAGQQQRGPAVGRPLQWPLEVAVMLLLAAGVGAAVALQWDRHAKEGVTAAPLMAAAMARISPTSPERVRLVQLGA